jgi:hypothetical protein
MMQRKDVETKEQFFTFLPTTALGNKSKIPFILQEKGRWKIG